MLVPVALLCIAALIKAAQMPFCTWLLGAMVAPTPSSALLHSSTMVKAGAYLLIRLAPGLGNTLPGIMVTYIGGITFLVASVIAISQSDGKKVLAYSTVANLGLIVTCAGIGTYESLWVAFLLILFHATAKSLMFLAVGTVEHTMGSRDIEQMRGLIVHMPRISILMVVGIAGMFLAPFGMLISKWAAMKAFVDSNQVLLLMILVFGSSATLFYWTKWLGSIMTVPAVKKKHKYPSPDEWFTIGALAVMTISVCLLFPLISRQIIMPYLLNIIHESFELLSRGDIMLMLMMLGMLLVLPLSFLLTGGDRSTRVDVYMAGENAGDNETFHGALGKTREVELSNWYMRKPFGEGKLLTYGTILTVVFLAVMCSILMTKVI
jgi:ech hydrogenase subunit A